MLFECVVVALLCGLPGSAEIPQYKRLKVYEVIPADNKQLEFVHKLSETDSGLHLWKLLRKSKAPAHVIVTTGKRLEFEKILEQNGTALVWHIPVCLKLFKMVIKCCTYLLFGAMVSAEYISYEGYKVYEAIPQNRSHSDLLWQLSEVSEELDFWTLSKLPNLPARVMVPPQFQDEFEGVMAESGITFNVINPDISMTIKKERIENMFLRSGGRIVGFSKFHRHEEINAYLDNLANRYPNRVQVSEVGQSYEKRTVKTIKISNGDGNKNKKVIFVDAGIHAREWIAPATALYIIHQLVENFDQNEYLLKNFDWVVLPVVNPDGYEYTHVRERFWRKTRKPTNRCSGTDGNRNFDFHWGETGASSQECSETFKGPTAFSEPETQIVRDILLSLRGRCKMYLTLHSYGKYLLYPWGFTSDLPDNWKDLDEVSRAGANAIRSHTGSRYTVGSSTNVLYASAGGSDDYALGSVGVPVAITMELPAGGSGFDPSPSQIKPMVTESWVGIKAMAEKIDEKYS